MYCVKVKVWWRFFLVGIWSPVLSGSSKAAGLERRRNGSVNKCTRHLQWLRREEGKKIRHRDAHGAFEGQMHLTKLVDNFYYFLKILILALT